MRKYQLAGNKVKRAVRQAIVKTVEVVNDIALPVRHNMSAEAQKAVAKTMTKGIFNTAYAVDAVVLRAKKSETGGATEVYGKVFKTTINNSPYTKALVEANGDLDKKDAPVVQIKHWDKSEKTLVNDYEVVCNQKDEKGKVCIATNALCIVDFSMLEADLNRIFKWDKEAVAKEKKEIIN